MTNYLNEIQLQKNVPSIFATGAAEKMSGKYGFIPTIEVVRGLKNSGFYPVMASQTKSRKGERESFSKHIMRFRHESALEIKSLIPEIVLVNSHDGSTSYQLRAGIYRLVCCNGLIVGEETFCRRVKHQGDVVNRVVEAANDIIEIIPISVKKALEWEKIELRDEQREVFAHAAAQLKWEVEEIPVTPQKILQPKRSFDDKNDLWTTFNIVQENIIRGGLTYRTIEGHRQKTRSVNSVNENVRLNTALWTLTEKMAELATR